MSMSLTRRIGRLVQKLHRVFSKDPEARLAFRVRTITGTLAWRVANGRFTVHRDGIPLAAIDLPLEGNTIGDLAAAVARLAGARVETGRARGYYETQQVPVQAATELDAGTVERTGSLPPGWTFTRAGRARYFDATGTLRTAEPDQVRVQWTNGVPGILTEPASRNVLRNPRFLSGTPGVIGQGGVLPRYMTIGGGRGLSAELLRIFTDEQGIPWAELRFFGTSIDPQLDLFFDGTPSPAAAGERWTASLYLRQSGGSLAGVTVHNGVLLSGTSSFAANGSMLNQVLPTATATRWARSTSATATATGVRQHLAIKPTIGQAMDLTLCVAIPQLEPGDLASSPMLPPAGQLGVATREDEFLYVLIADLPGLAESPELSVAVDFLHPNHPHDKDQARGVLGISGRPEGEQIIGVVGNQPMLQVAQSAVLGKAVRAAGLHGFNARGIVATTLRGATAMVSFNGAALQIPEEPAGLSRFLRPDGTTYLDHLGRAYLRRNAFADAYVLRSDGKPFQKPTYADANFLQADGTPYLNTDGEPYRTRVQAGSEPYLTKIPTADYYLPPGETPQPNAPTIYAGHSGSAITRLAVLARALTDAELQALSASWRWPTVAGQVYVDPVPDFAEAVEQGRILARPATLLIDGAGEAELRGRDELQTPTAILWGFLSAYAAELNVASANIERAPLAMATTTSEGEWLDELGSIYGYRRKLGEGERAYGERIIREVLRPRGNNVAIEMAIEEATGAEATVTNVVQYGQAEPDHSGRYRYDIKWRHDASAKPIYGLFDVEAAFDLLGSDTPNAYQATVRELVERMRDAGTFLRAIIIRGGDIGDTGLPGEDQAEPLPLDATATLDDAGLAAADADPVFEGSADLADTGAIPDDSEDVLLLSWFTLYDGSRRYGAVMQHSGGQEVASTLAS